MLSGFKSRAEHLTAVAEALTSGITSTLHTGHGLHNVFCSKGSAEKAAHHPKAPRAQQPEVPILPLGDLYPVGLHLPVQLQGGHISNRQEGAHG